MTSVLVFLNDIYIYMEITLLDFCLINIISYIAGLGTGLLVCCKNKDKFFVRSSSIDGIHSLPNNPSQSHYSSPPIVASSPLDSKKHPVKITLE